MSYSHGTEISLLNCRPLRPVSCIFRQTAVKTVTEYYSLTSIHASKIAWSSASGFCLLILKTSFARVTGGEFTTGGRWACDVLIASVLDAVSEAYHPKHKSALQAFCYQNMPARVPTLISNHSLMWRIRWLKFSKGVIQCLEVFRTDWLIWLTTPAELPAISLVCREA